MKILSEGAFCRCIAQGLPALLLAVFSLPAADRITAPIDTGHSAPIPNHVRQLAGAYRQEGPLDPAEHLDGLALYFKPSLAQKAELDQLLREQQDPASPRYHRWITPEQYADRFAISAADAAAVAAWLASQGFHVGAIARSRSHVVFDGTVSAVESAFHADLRRYRSPAAVHFANSRNPSVPLALQDIVGFIGGLDDFQPVSSPRRPHPQYTGINSLHTLAPGDIAVIYDFVSLLNAGIDGTGQTIVVVGQSNILPSDISLWGAHYNLTPPNVQVTTVPNYPDPGITSSMEEADLDITAVAAAARNATIQFVYSGSAFVAVAYAIDQNLAPVISASFYFSCDTLESASVMNGYQALALQGNAQGITWLNSSGDSGAAGCDANGEVYVSRGLATRFPADIPEVTAVGGTEFNDQGGTYWAASNDSHDVSALSYIPEIVWNDTATAGFIDESGGGASSFFAKPAWQIAPGVPADGQRDVPDVSLTASPDHDPYMVYYNGNLSPYGGTSESAPLFAGMVVLLNQYLVANGAQPQPGLGNLNVMLYRLAQSIPSAFHDVTVGNNIARCFPGTPDCPTGTTGYGYTAGPGYDLCTGLGSVDLAKLAAAAAALPVVNSSIAVSSSANPVYQQKPFANGSAWTVALTLTESGGSQTTVTGMTIDGQSYPVSAYFPSAGIDAYGVLTSQAIYLSNTQIPQTRTFGFQGTDPSGRSWTAQISLPFLGFPPGNLPGNTPSIAGATNGASFQQIFAPGMVMSVFGAQFSNETESAPSVPLPTYLPDCEATINGVLAPLYYVSPTQVNLQIPYGTAPGAATLTVYQTGASSTGQIQIAPSAPGIFTDGNGNTVPYAQGSAGQTLSLFLTGDGEVSPALASGAAPPLSTPLSNLPASILPVSLTIGGVGAKITFHGIPYGLAGVTQINFVVPAGLAPGPQPVVVTVGTVSSKAATFTIVN